MINVSVITPIFNASKFLHQFLESYQIQKNIYKELICVDDCSTDNSIDIISDFSKRDPSIRIIKNTTNMGSGYSRNIGLKAAKGEFVFFADPDDCLFYSYSLYHLFIAAKKTKALIISGNVHFIANQTDPVDNISWVHKYYTKATFDNWIISKYQSDMWQLLINREFLIINNIYFPLSRRSQDGIFVTRLMAHCREIYRITRSVYKYRIGYRFINLNTNLITELIAAYDENLKYLLNNNAINVIKNFIAPIGDFPDVIAWMSPYSRLDNKLLYELYGINEYQANNLIDKIDNITKKYLPFIDKLSEVNNPQEESIKTYYTYNKKIRLGFDKFERFFKQFKKIHLLSYDTDYSFILSTVRHDELDEHLFIYVRSAEALPCQFCNPSLNNIHVLDDVNLSGLKAMSAFIFNRKDTKVFIHSLFPKPLFMFLNEININESVILSVFGINQKIDLLCDGEVLSFLSKIKSAQSPFKKDQEQIYSINKNCNFTLLSLANVVDFTKYKALSNNKLEKNLVVLVADNENIVSSCLDSFIKEKLEDSVLVIFRELLPGRLNYLKEKYKSHSTIQFFDESYVSNLYKFINKIKFVQYEKSCVFDFKIVLYLINNNVIVKSKQNKNIDLINELIFASSY